MEHQTIEVYAGIAGEGVAQVTIFPTGKGFDDEDLEGFDADGDGESLLVVILEILVRFDGDLEVEGVFTDAARGPDE
jgi:hypothetical protein